MLEEVSPTENKKKQDIQQIQELFEEASLTRSQKTKEIQEIQHGYLGFRWGWPLQNWAAAHGDEINMFGRFRRILADSWDVI